MNMNDILFFGVLGLMLALAIVVATLMEKNTIDETQESEMVEEAVTRAEALRKEADSWKTLYETRAAAYVAQAKELDDTKGRLEFVRDDFRATDDGWEELGSGLAELVGLEWNCDNDELLQKVRGLKGDLAEARERDIWARAKLAEVEKAIAEQKESIRELAELSESEPIQAVGVLMKLHKKITAA